MHGKQYHEIGKAFVHPRRGPTQQVEDDKPDKSYLADTESCFQKTTPSGNAIHMTGNARRVA